MDNRKIFYSYDDKGDRIIKNETNAKELYLRDHTGRELAILDLTTNRLKSFNLFGNELIGKVDAIWTERNGTDAEGTPVTWFERNDERFLQQPFSFKEN